MGDEGFGFFDAADVQAAAEGVFLGGFGVGGFDADGGGLAGYFPDAVDCESHNHLTFRTASKRPARMQTTIPCKFDLKGDGLDALGKGQWRGGGFYWSDLMRMLKMEGNIGGRGYEMLWFEI